MNFASEIAEYWCETPLRILFGSRSSCPDVQKEIESLRSGKIDHSKILIDLFDKQTRRMFPAATEGDILMAIQIAAEVLAADIQVRDSKLGRGWLCDCGSLGAILLTDDLGQPTGVRRCYRCDLKDAAKVKCRSCGGCMDPDSVRAGYASCDKCDADGEDMRSGNAP
jgi:hypothetical protein